ncbi:PQQ-dependent sugar dehydrogenase [uncultured Lacinutrix sp.]|uniref:PQQ-dependent sugar dehydrogenase n=1 Tax=uncultured Lacinutrix sp. TaxID=574032 RepID=UPI00261AF238|nr:PQQ-dependent sugar dehydrogenase [uncultured Lacinutrix sp.]
MKKTLLFMAIFCLAFINAQTPTTDGPDWTVTNITSDNALDFPWEITYAPDDNLWITERIGEKIVNFNIANSTISTMIDLSSRITTSKQGGLMGMAIHPDLYNNINTVTNNYVFASYTYDDAGTLKTRIVRLLYNSVTGLLTEDSSTGNVNGSIVEGMPGSADHNSGRLIFGPDLKLYYTIGDQGANQFDNACDPILAQVLPTSATDFDSYPGKTLRINTDGSIPTDNPIFNSVQSHVYTYGHRNAQGIIFAQDGTLYNSEHGAKVDDELNKVIAGKNYGWPEIAGYYDNMAYAYCNWSSLGGGCNAGDFSDHNCPNGVTAFTEFESFPSGPPSDFQPPIGTYNSTTDVDPSGGFLSWPSIAPSSIDIHETGNIPCWDRSLLIPSLKRGTIFRAKLTPDGNDVVGDYYEELHSSDDRYRDIAISPDGLTIYAVTDNSGGTSGPSSGGFVTITNPGVIVKLEYVGPLSTDPIASPTLEDVVSYCSITVDAPEVMSNNCTVLTGTTTDPTTYSSGTNIVEWSFNDNGNVVTANQNVIINALEVPSNISVVPSNVSADISWDNLGNTIFEVRYREVGASTWLTETTSVNSITLTSLTLSTNYEFQVLSDCGGTQSAYSTVTNFTTLAITYCDAQGVAAGHISNVLLNGENSTSINSSSSTNVAYTDYTSLSPVDLKKGETYSMQVSTSYNASGVSVWIDYNQDGDFDDSNEKVWDDAVGTTEASPRSNSFLIPSGVLVGSTRMRVASRQYYTISGSCGDVVEAGQDSEVEDYTVNIIEESLGVNALSLEVFNISPNPFNSQIKINKPSSIKDLTITLFDIHGRIIRKEAISGNQSGTITINNLDDLNAGVYFVRISDGNSVSSAKKLVKI